MSTVQDLLTRQQFVMIKSNLLQSLQLHYLPLQSQNWNTAHCSHSTVASV